MVISVAGKIGSGKDTVGKIIQLLTADNELKDKNPEDVLRQYEYCEKNKLWDTLVINNSTDWRIKKFAGKLKQIVSILTGIPVEDLEKQEVKDRVLGEEWNKSYPLDRETMLQEHKYWEDRPMTVRQLLQEIGTDSMRNVVHPNVWVNSLFADYKDILIKPTTSYYSEKSNIPTGIVNTIPEYRKPNWIITDMRFPNELKAVKDRGGITIRVNRPFIPKEGDKIQIKVFSNWSEVLYSHTDEGGSHYGHGSDGYKYKSNLIKPITDKHLSETSLDNAEFGYTIDNNQGILELIKKVKEILIKEKIL